QALPSSRKSRLRCLALCVSNGTSWLETDEQRRQLAELALPEAVLGSTEQNSQAREAADSLLLEVFRFYAQQVRTDVDEDDDAGGNAAIGFLAAVFAAAGNEPATLQAALYSVTGLLSHLRHCMNRSLLASLLQRLSDTNVRFGQSENAGESGAALFSVGGSATVRRILTDLLAGFPYETLRAGLPAFYHKQLTNVRKRTEHKERLKQRGKRGEDSQTAAGREDSSSIGGRSEATRVVRGIDDLLNMSSDSSASEDGDGRRSKSAKSGNKSRSKRSADSAWLEEADDEILDLRDSLAAARIHRSRPPLSADAADAASKRRRLGDDFKLSSDGRLIIEESDSDDADISEKG
uniref:CBF domain-containing protein n=1 Tax=Macrostomum lignano TaxID=282301 RepID=A0A1I8GPE8_9PLAT